jgi:hypothetical protein
MNAAGIVWKFFWVGAATLFGLFIGITQLWDTISKYFKARLSRAEISKMSPSGNSFADGVPPGP